MGPLDMTQKSNKTLFLSINTVTDYVPSSSSRQTTEKVACGKHPPPSIIEISRGPNSGRISDNDFRRLSEEGGEGQQDSALLVAYIETCTYCVCKKNTCFGSPLHPIIAARCLQ
jgi:hypothetical protein